MPSTWWRLILFTSIWTMSLSAAWPQTKNSKIDPEIFLHRDLKQSARNLKASDKARRLAAYGLNPQNDTIEDCALYVDHPLSESAIKALASQGIAIEASGWVPPVPGQHPRGFYLARVAYSSLGALAADARVISVNSVERAYEPQNFLGRQQLHVDAVHAGQGVVARTGHNVKIAVADSGIDLTHPDLPAPIEKYDVTDGATTATWGDNVANTVSSHGTHVAGSVLGRGTRSVGRYAGTAKGAKLYFYKIGNDMDGTTGGGNMIEAINRAAAVGCDIFTMSYGGMSDTFMDGSDAVCQAIDAAVAGGMAVFISAGNDQTQRQHESLTVAPGATSPVFSYIVDNTAEATAYTDAVWLRVIWRDGAPADANIALTCTNLGDGESLTLSSTASSPRNTESRLYALSCNVPAGATRTYNLRLANSAAAGATPRVHCFHGGGEGRFTVGDPNFTIGTPALADSAIAVGAWVQDADWVNYKGNDFTRAGEVAGTLATFSSLGPRIDGHRKPDIVAPGAVVISCSDSLVPPNESNIIDNDGLHLDGSGPAEYAVMSGTSMACPLAAGVGALLVEHNPGITPAQLLAALTSTASRAENPDNRLGFGLINARAAINSMALPEIDVRPASLAFGDQKIHAGPTASQIVAVNNTAYGDLCPSRIQILGTDAAQFSFVRPPSLAPIPWMGGQLLEVRFDPSSTGAKSARIEIASNDANEPLVTIPLTGRGLVAPQIRVEKSDGSPITNGATVLRVGTALQGSPAISAWFRVRNIGSAPLNTSNLVVPAPFYLINGLQSSIAAGASDTVAIGLNTATPGTFTGSVIFDHNDAAEISFAVPIAAAINGGPVLHPEPEWSPGTTNTLTWDAVGGASEYIVQCASTYSFAPVLKSLTVPASQASATLTGLNHGTRYYYRLRARDAQGQASSWSASVISTQDAAAPTGTLRINKAGDLFTNRTLITLTPSLADQGSGIHSWRFRNPGAAWSSWRDAKSTATLTLPVGDGLKTVYAEYRDVAGNVTPVLISAKITLDQTRPASAVSTSVGSLLSPKITLKWSADDGLKGSGVTSVAVYYSRDKETFIKLGSFLPGTTGIMFDTGHHGGSGTYGFLTLATDNAGNVEAYSGIDATITIITPRAGARRWTRYE